MFSRNRFLSIGLLIVCLVIGEESLMAKRSCHCQRQTRKVWGYINWNKLHKLKGKKKKAVVLKEEVLGATTSRFNDRKKSRNAGRIKKIRLWHGEVLNALQVVYKNKTLLPHPSLYESDPTSVIKIPKHNPLVNVSGVYGIYFGAQHFAQVIFTLRDGQTFGPFGSGGSMGIPTTPFSIGTDKEIFAFLGGSYRHTDNSEFLSSLGVFMRGRP